MSVFGGVSKGERNRIRVRVRTAMATQALTLLHDADLASKAELYAQLGLCLTYQPGPGTRIVTARADIGRTCTQLSCPRGDLNPHALYGH
jgi:hypothetical protein